MKISRKLPLFGALLGAFALTGAPKIAQAAPAVNLVTPSGLKAAIAKNKGKVVVVNFWATWCGPCVKELPDLARLKRANAKKGVVVILVSGDENDNKTFVSKTLAKKGHSGTYMIPGGIEGINDFGKQFDPKTDLPFGFPRTYIYNRKGQLVKKAANGNGNTQAELQSMINPYL